MRRRLALVILHKIRSGIGQRITTLSCAGQVDLLTGTKMSNMSHTILLTAVGSSDWAVKKTFRAATRYSVLRWGMLLALGSTSPDLLVAPCLFPSCYLTVLWRVLCKTKEYDIICAYLDDCLLDCINQLDRLADHLATAVLANPLNFEYFGLDNAIRECEGLSSHAPDRSLLAQQRLLSPLISESSTSRSRVHPVWKADRALTASIEDTRNDGVSMMDSTLGPVLIDKNAIATMQPHLENEENEDSLEVYEKIKHELHAREVDEQMYLQTETVNSTHTNAEHPFHQGPWPVLRDQMDVNMNNVDQIEQPSRDTACKTSTVVYSPSSCVDSDRDKTIEDVQCCPFMIAPGVNFTFEDPDWYRIVDPANPDYYNFENLYN